MFYLLDKPSGISSFKFIKQFAQEHGINKIGHTGTLDPLASGLLLVATGADTKLINYVDQGFKTYVASACFGQTSDTYDVLGKITQILSYKVPILREIQEAFQHFAGQTMQTPPLFSAKKIKGQRAYKLALQGQKLKLKPKQVTMKNFKILSLNEATLTFQVTVSRGTYIRSLIHDLGQHLKCGALMTKLRRIKIGNLTEAEINKEVDIAGLLSIPIMATKKIKPFQYGLIIPTKNQKGLYALKYQGQIVGIVKVEAGFMKVHKLFGLKLANF